MTLDVAKTRRVLLIVCGALFTIFWLWLVRLALAMRAEKRMASTGTGSVSETTKANRAGNISTPRKVVRAPRRKAARQRRQSIGLEKILLAVEVGAIFLFVAVALSLWQTRRDLNTVYRNLQKTDPQVLPTLMAAANPGVAVRQPVMPQGGQRLFVAPPIPTQYPTVTPVAALAALSEPVDSAARVDEKNALVEADSKVAGVSALDNSDIVTQNLAANEISTIAFGMSGVVGKRAPDTGQPRRLQIPAIDVDSFIYQDYGEDWLKLGVVQVGQPVAAGAPGNLVLAGHSDIYGEVFRDLNDLEPGHDIFVMSDSLAHKYRVRETLIVEPDDVWVMLPTSTPTLTLVSCYPYLVGTQRIVVFADLAQSDLAQ